MPIKPYVPPPRFITPGKRRSWLPYALVVSSLTAVVSGAATGYLLNRDLPDVRALEDYRPPTVSRILAADGRVIHQFAEQRRYVVPLRKMSDTLKNAVIAVEDSNFFEHVGVDPTALMRAAWRDLIEMRYAQGGSTLTQQLAKVLFLHAEKTVRRKIQEAILAVQIEKTYTKAEILEFYLNQIYMGHGRYGMEAASQFYFGVSASEVNLEQAAMLAGIIRRPEAYSPVNDRERAIRRRNHVLDRMAAEGFLDPETLQASKLAAVAEAPTEIWESEAAYFSEEIRKILVSRFGDEALLREGLTIQTALDLDLQLAAEKALSKGLRELDKRRGFRRPSTNILRQGLGDLESYEHPAWDRPLREGDLVTGLVVGASPLSATIRVGEARFTISPDDARWTELDDMTKMLRPGDLTLFEVKSAGNQLLALSLDQEPEVEGAVLALDPQTGDVKAMVGGFDFGRSQFNRSVQAMRQCGSAFKPFIYATAIENGRSPSDLLFDEPTVFLDPVSRDAYQPENYEREYNGVVTLRRALEESINLPTVMLLNQIGYERTVELARRLGLRSKLYAYPSLALGTSEVSLMDLTAAYGVFPAGGILSTPRYYSEVLDREGNVLEEVKPLNREVLRGDVAAVMVSMMQGVIERGTATSAMRPNTPLAGKTGTTDDYTDAWFVGYGPSIVIGVWVGHDRKVTLGPQETGARAALPIWSRVMDDYIERHPGGEFPSASGVVTLPVDRNTGLRVAPELGCEVVITETFLRGSEIARPCTANTHRRLQLPYYLQRYWMTEGGRILIADEELDRLLMENPHHLRLADRANLSAATPAGVRLVRLSRAPDPNLESTWSFLLGRDPPQAEELAYSQLLPSEMPPLGQGPLGFLGIDGRTAAVIEVRYP